MKTWFAEAAALFAAGDYAGILMPQYFSVYAALAVVFAVLIPYIFYLVWHGGRQ